MNRDNERQSAIILSVIGIIPVVWLALLIAPSVKRRIAGNTAEPINSVQRTISY